MYVAADDSCAAQFDALLALDHSRREPWGSRHGQAFAAFALQHPSAYPASLGRAWAVLHRIYVDGEAPARVFRSLAAAAGPGRAVPSTWRTPPRPPRPVAAPAVTIVDLADFTAATYPERLDAWCRATLVAWGASSVAPA